MSECFPRFPLWADGPYSLGWVTCFQKCSRANLQSTVVMALSRHGHNLEVARLGCGVVAGCCQKSNQNASCVESSLAVQPMARNGLDLVGLTWPHLWLDLKLLAILAHIHIGHNNLNRLL